MGVPTTNTFYHGATFVRGCGNTSKFQMIDVSLPRSVSRALGSPIYVLKFFQPTRDIQTWIVLRHQCGNVENVVTSREDVFTLLV